MSEQSSKNPLTKEESARTFSKRGNKKKPVVVRYTYRDAYRYHPLLRSYYEKWRTWGRYRDLKTAEAVVNKKMRESSRLEFEIINQAAL